MACVYGVCDCGQALLLAALAALRGAEEDICGAKSLPEALGVLGRIGTGVDAAAGPGIASLPGSPLSRESQASPTSPRHAPEATAIGSPTPPGAGDARAPPALLINADGSGDDGDGDVEDDAGRECELVIKAVQEARHVSRCVCVCVAAWLCVSTIAVHNMRRQGGHRYTTRPFSSHRAAREAPCWVHGKPRWQWHEQRHTTVAVSAVATCPHRITRELRRGWRWRVLLLQRRVYAGALQPCVCARGFYVRAPHWWCHRLSTTTTWRTLTLLPRKWTARFRQLATTRSPHHHW